MREQTHAFHSLLSKYCCVLNVGSLFFLNQHAFLWFPGASLSFSQPGGAIFPICFTFNFDFHTQV